MLPQRRETLVIVAHSYGQQLADAGLTELVMQSTVHVSQTTIEIKYVVEPGANYDYFLDHSIRMKEVAAYEPDFILVILAGNSVGSEEEKSDIERKSLEFYRRLRWYAPNALIIAAQAEMRYYPENNAFGAPTEWEYRSKRNWFNKRILNEKLRAAKYMDFILMVAGDNRLDKRELRKGDGVHMKPEAVAIYVTQLTGMMHYVHTQIKERVHIDNAIAEVGARHEQAKKERKEQKSLRYTPYYKGG